jgi:outer membrane protein
MTHRFVSFGAVLAVLAAVAPAALGQVVPAAPKTLPTPLTLQQAISIALAHQPQQYISKDQITQASGRKLQAQSQYYPTVTPSYRFQNNTQSTFGGQSQTFNTTGGATGTTTGDTTGGTTGTTTGGTTGTTTGGTTGTTTSGTTGTTFTTSSSTYTTTRGGGLTINLSQSLYDGGAREASNAQARRGVDAAKYNDVNTRQSTILNATQAYYQLLLAQDLVKVSESQVARFQQTVDVTKAQIDAGTTAAKDIYQAQADLANAQVTLLQNQNQIVTSSAALKNALGVDTSDPVVLAPISEGGALPPAPTPEANPLTLEDALKTAYDNRPDLRQQAANVESDRAALQLAKRNAGFNVTSDYTLSYQATNDVGTKGLSTALTLNGSYPLFDAGNARGAVRIAQATFDSDTNTLEQQRQNIRRDVEQALSTRNQNLQAAQLAQSAVTAAQVNYDAVIASRREGIGTVLDVTTAQATLTQAQNQFVTAVYNSYIADAQLQRAIGRNDVGVTAP